MDVVMFKWFDELNNESRYYFLKKEDCDLDIEEWKRVGYKPIGTFSPARCRLHDRQCNSL